MCSYEVFRVLGKQVFSVFQFASMWGGGGVGALGGEPYGERRREEAIRGTRTPPETQGSPGGFPFLPWLQAIVLLWPLS